MAYLRREDFPSTRTAWGADFVAGLTVSIVALPLAIGFGITSGLSAASGIATAIVAGFLAALLGGSRYQVSGPTGAMTVVLLPVIAKFGVAAIPLLGFMSAVILLLLAALRVGVIIKKVPDPVVEGFTVGIAIVIALQQLPAAFGVSKGSGSRTISTAFHTVQNAISNGLHWWTLVVLALTLIAKFNIVKILERFHVKPYIPASFSALIIATAIVKIFSIKTDLIGSLPRNVVKWTPLHFSGTHMLSLVYPAISIALLSSIEALLAARVADELMNVPHSEEFRPNQELFGQSIATFFATLVGGMPSTGAIARTNVNVRSHANSRIAAMFHAALLLLIVIFFAPVFAQIPKAAIAGVLIGTSFRIFNKATMLEIFKSSKNNVAIFLVTAVVVVSVDLIWGIGIGVLLYGISSVLSRNKTR